MFTKDGADYIRYAFQLEDESQEEEQMNASGDTNTIQSSLDAGVNDSGDATATTTHDTTQEETWDSVDDFQPFIPEFNGSPGGAAYGQFSDCEDDMSDPVVSLPVRVMDQKPDTQYKADNNYFVPEDAMTQNHSFAKQKALTHANQTLEEGQFSDVEDDEG